MDPAAATRASRANGIPFRALLAGILGAGLAAAAAAQDAPWAAIDRVSLDPTNFYVSVVVSNAPAGRQFALEAYEGPPVGPTGGVQRAIVSAWTEGTDSTLTLYDVSAPLSFSGRTYNAAISLGGGDYILGPNEVHAPYPFLSAPVISALAALPTATGSVLAVTYGEGLYTNTVFLPGTAAAGFLRIRGSNNLPTNAIIERCADPTLWPTE